MKQIVPGIFRRRRGNNNKAAAAHSISQIPISDSHDDRAIVIADSSSTRVIDIARSKVNHGMTDATVSTLTVGRPNATMEASERLLQEDEEDQRRSARGYADAAHGGNDLAPPAHPLSIREQMWYKNQMYLLDKQRKEQTTTSALYNSPHRGTGNNRLSSRYESNDRRGVDRYADPGINSGQQHRDSPKGVDEFVSTNMYKNVNHCESRKEVRFCSNKQRSTSQVVSQNNDDNDTWTNQSSSMFDEDDTRTNQSSSLFDDETRTTQSSLLFDDDDDDTRANQSSSIFHDDDASESNFDEVTLGSTTLDEGDIETTPDDGTSMSYVFELLDDDGGAKQQRRKKYQLGVCQNDAKTSSKLRKGTMKATLSSGVEGTSTRRRRRGNDSTDDNTGFAADEVPCPLLPQILEEVSGTYTDAKSALNQIFYAFFVSPDDIDRVADKLRDAKLELVEMYHDQVEERHDCVRFA